MIRKRHIKRLSEIESDETRQYMIFERKPGNRQYKFIGGNMMTGHEAMNFFCISAYNVERAAADYQDAGVEFDGGKAYQIRKAGRGVVVEYRHK
jgi:hypothetical protein